MLKWFNHCRTRERIGYAFTDTVDGCRVYYWRDKDEVVWLKNSRWALFSVRSSMVDRPEDK